MKRGKFDHSLSFLTRKIIHTFLVEMADAWCVETNDILSQYNIKNYSRYQSRWYTGNLRLKHIDPMRQYQQQYWDGFILREDENNGRLTADIYSWNIPASFFAVCPWVHSNKCFYLSSNIGECQRKSTRLDRNTELGYNVFDGVSSRRACLTRCGLSGIIYSRAHDSVLQQWTLPIMPPLFVRWSRRLLSI